MIVNNPPTGGEASLALEALRMGQALLAALLGGLFVVLGGWLADRRKLRAERDTMERRKRALLTGMSAVRNQIAARLADYQEHGLLSGLEPLRTAQAYVHRLIERAPDESESLMIAVVEVGLTLDALLATVDRWRAKPGLTEQMKMAQEVTRDVNELLGSLEQFDVIASGSLTFLSEDEVTALMARSPTASQRGPQGSGDH